jgi:hypothetical protein
MAVFQSVRMLSVTVCRCVTAIVSLSEGERSDARVFSVHAHTHLRSAEVVCRKTSASDIFLFANVGNARCPSTLSAQRDFLEQWGTRTSGGTRRR